MAVPRLPSQAEIEEGRRKRALEAEELAKKEPTLGASTHAVACQAGSQITQRSPNADVECALVVALADDRIALALEAKLRGNKLVAQGDMMDAKKAYDEGFVRLFFSREEWDGGVLSDDEKAKVNEAKVGGACDDEGHSCSQLHSPTPHFPCASCRCT